MKRRIPRDEAAKVSMSESSVRVMVYEAFTEYEDKVGLPRHKENLRINQENLKVSQDSQRESAKEVGELKTFAQQAITVLKTLGFLGGLFLGLPATLIAIIALLRYMRGH